MGESLVDTLRAESLRGQESLNSTEQKEQRARDEEEARRQVIREEGYEEYAAKMRPFFIDRIQEKAAVAAKAGEFTTGIVWRLQREDDFDALKFTMEGVKDHFVEEGFQAETNYWTNADTHGVVTGDGADIHFRPTTLWAASVDISWATPQE